MSYNNVPASLKTLRQWVCYRTQARENGKLAKIPVDPKTLNDAKANDPGTWATFEEAVAAAQRHRLAGIGIEFANGVFGVDLDGVIDAAGNVTPEALDIVATLDSYTEYSPSGSGLHILCKGSIPPGKRRNGPFEMYEGGRFFTVTGRPFGPVRELQERTQAAAIVHSKYINPVETKTAQEAARSPQRAPESDQDIISKMFASRNGAEIRDLWNGNDRGDHSAADLALVNHLCYWTNGDAAAIDRLFRASGLMRDKWDRPESTFGTYGNRTIQTALAKFTPWEPAGYTYQDALRDFDDLDAPASPPVGSQPTADPLEGLQSAADYLKNNFTADREQFKGYKQRKTGFADIDDYTGGLYPGLYVLGALSSLGKTTFAHQMADQLAKAGDTVLFFSLEQSTFELTTKSLARESFKLMRERRATAGALSAIEIRSGRSSDLMREAYKNYLETGGRVIVKECNFGDSTESIAATVAAYIAKTGVKPIVIVDYLQIIPGTDPRMSDKEKVDQNMRRLKIMQRDNDLVVFVISALNRSNYLTQISFESFRESSGIEYTADVVWGMQYACISRDQVFLKDTKIGEKRKRLQEAKAETPRDIELICLKNRYGRDFSTAFYYYPKFDFFEPAISPPEPEEDGTTAADVFNEL